MGQGGHILGMQLCQPDLQPFSQAVPAAQVPHALPSPTAQQQQGLWESPGLSSR